MTTLRLRAPLPEPGQIRAIRSPSEPISHDDATGEFILTFEPDLTAQEQAALDAAIALTRSAIQVTPAEWASLQNEIDGLKIYHNLATPTAAQTALATKAIIRILRAVFRDAS